MASESLEDRFKKAVWIIRNGPKMESSNEQKLTFYSYFKQVGQRCLLEVTQGARQSPRRPGTVRRCGSNYRDTLVVLICLVNPTRFRFQECTIPEQGASVHSLRRTWIPC